MSRKDDRMSFSSDIKSRLIENKSDKKSLMAYALGLIGFGAELRADSVRFTTENESVAKSIQKDLYELFKIDCICEEVRGYRITIKDKKEKILVKIAEFADLSVSDCIKSNMPEESEKKSFITGAFMTGGSVSDPKKSYHIEFVTRYREFSIVLQEILKSFGLNARITERKGQFIVYVKEYEAIAFILGLIGAGSAALELYTVQVEKEMRNDINRRINFETANVDKITKAAAKQIQAINVLMKNGKFEKLPEVLKEIGRLRKDNPEASLKQLGEMLSPPIGKSGVNHRLERIIEIAEVK